MQLRQIEKMAKCEVLDCENHASFSFQIKSVFKKQVHICEECLKKMFKSYVGTSVPRSVESPFKPKSKIRREK